MALEVRLRRERAIHGALRNVDLASELVPDGRELVLVGEEGFWFGGTFDKFDHDPGGG